MRLFIALLLISTQVFSGDSDNEANKNIHSSFLATKFCVYQINAFLEPQDQARFSSIFSGAAGKALWDEIWQYEYEHRYKRFAEELGQQMLAPGLSAQPRLLIASLINKRCFRCQKKTYTFDTKRNRRICLSCIYKKQSSLFKRFALSLMPPSEGQKDKLAFLHKIKTLPRYICLTGAWFYELSPSIVVSDQDHKGQYQDALITPSLFEALEKAENGSMILILKDVIIDRLPRECIDLRKSIKLVGGINEATGGDCAIKTRSTFIAFAPLIIQNLTLHSGLNAYDDALDLASIPSWREAYPCIQLATQILPSNFYIEISHCKIKGEHGSGLLVQSWDDRGQLLVYENNINNCSYAGVCIVRTPAKLAADSTGLKVFCNQIGGCGSWGIQDDVGSLEELNEIIGCEQSF